MKGIYVDRATLRDLRLTREMTQRQLAHDAKLSRVTLCDIENMADKGVQLRTVYKLANALQVKPEELLMGEPVA
jgi:transcriptional regulator with XRE-family HTH domain